MWTSRLQQIDRQTIKATLSGDSRALPYREVLELWQSSSAFRESFAELLRQCPFEAFFWEVPPVTERTLNRSFEFVMVEGKSLAELEPDPSPFMPHFTSRRAEEVLTFPNLGGDAILVVPAPMADVSCYTHLAQFLRNAPRSQVDAFWHSVGVAMRDCISNAPTWLSTAGMGVSWLHLRLDSRPKYYRHEPYKAAAN